MKLIFILFISSNLFSEITIDKYIAENIDVSHEVKAQVEKTEYLKKICFQKEQEMLFTEFQKN